MIGCYDKTDALICEVKVVECFHWFDCASLWFNCPGEWRCSDPDGICDQGACITEGD